MDACVTITRTFGTASRSKVASSGASSSRRVRLSMRGGAVRAAIAWSVMVTFTSQPLWKPISFH
jgi:hypothetical protein